MDEGVSLLELLGIGIAFIGAILTGGFLLALCDLLALIFAW